MAVDLYEVRGNAQAFIDAIVRMTPKEKEQVPTVSYAQNFNNVLELAKEVAPHVDGRIWPAAICFDQPVGYGVIATTRYSEIETYSRQIVNLLPDEPLLPSRG